MKCDTFGELLFNLVRRKAWKKYPVKIQLDLASVLLGAGVRGGEL